MVLRDDKTLDEEKLKEYQKQQNIYKLVELKKREDFVKVDRFKKMLEENVEQFYAIFIQLLYAAGTNPIHVAKHYRLPLEESVNYQGDDGNMLTMVAEDLPIKDKI